VKNVDVRLSIVIPTYNRSRLLQRLLESVAPAAARCGVELWVVDNCSADGTAALLASLASRFPGLRSQVNAETVSIDENMRRAMLLATGDYVFPLGDDDDLPPGALPEILAELESSPDLLSLGVQTVNAEFEPTAGPREGQALLGRTFDDPRQALLHLRVPPFGSFVVKREIIAAETFARYAGTCHAYLGMVWEGLARKFAVQGSVLVSCSRGPLVHLNIGVEKAWNSSIFKVYFRDVPHYLGLLPVSLRPAAAEVRESWMRNYVDVIQFIDWRRQRKLTSTTHRQALAFLDDEAQEKLRLVMAIPGPLLNLSRSLVKRWRRLRTWLQRRRDLPPGSRPPPG
jgi:glycosyltransferase involved in cell wall biosynthesis